MMGAAAAAGGLLLMRSEYERDQLVTEVFRIRSPKNKGEGKRFVFMTDLNDKKLGKEN